MTTTPSRLIRFIAVALVLSLPIESVTGEQTSSCIVLPKDTGVLTAGVGIETSPLYRTVDLRLMNAKERGVALGKVRKNDLVVASRELLNDPGAIREIKASHAAFCLVDAPSAQVQGKLHAPVQGVEIYAEVPTNAHEISNVYGPSAAAPAAFLRKMTAIRDGFRGKQPPTQGTEAQAVLAAARTHSKALLVVLAHNDGQRLRFPDGTFATPSDFSDALKTSGRQGVIISCDTIDTLAFPATSTTKRLDFEAAARALNTVVDPQSYGDFLSGFAKNYRDPRSHTQQVLVLTMGGLLVIVIIAILCHEKDDCFGLSPRVAHK
jgi:hypothetical protein